ncbi:MAG TPA: type II toxin-antitoxin system RelE/ParE family toxin [Candidatus Polarisedimenticolaceae bacterium]
MAGPYVESDIYSVRPKRRKPVVWLHGEVRTPPFSTAARVRVGFLLGRVQQGVNLPMPDSRPMAVLGPRCHELRVADHGIAWRVIYRVDPDAVLVAGVFAKKTGGTPPAILSAAAQRLRRYDDESR